jgi:hypothetical protein
VIKKIISGGQTGADQGGLAAAVKIGLETGGWIPKGWRTEVGANFSLKKLNLREHSSSAYQPRTRDNVTDADGTLVFGNIKSPGCKLTVSSAEDIDKPLFIVEWESGMPSPKSTSEFVKWVIENDIEILNVAGNRESKQPGIFEEVIKFIIESVSELNYKVLSSSGEK